MKTKNRQFVKQGGSALILVVVVTVLLAVVGVMFMMVSRASEMETMAVIESKDLGNGLMAACLYGLLGAKAMSDEHLREIAESIWWYSKRTIREIGAQQAAINS